MENDQFYPYIHHSVTTKNPKSEKVYCRRCPTPAGGTEKTSFLRSEEDAMMSHFLTHLPPNQVPIVCPCKPEKYRFNSSSALRRHANKF